MEAVPRMPMVHFDLKCSSEPVEFSSILKSYILSFYHENPETYSKECSEVDQLRQAVVNVTRDFTGCSVLKKYYSQLQFLQTRFPMGEGGAAALPVTWEDVYSGRPVTVADIRFEQACVLYNIGALHSILGALDNRQNPDGMKVSCTHFQCAAWALQHLRDHFGTSVSPDINHDLLTFKINLMLAQAQECILEKSMTDNRKSSITAKVAAQIVEYYRLAAENLESCNPSQVIGSKKHKEWKKRMELKSAYQQCIMYYYLGCQVEEQQKWGERVTYFQAAIDKLNDCVKLSKNDESTIDEALRFTMDVVGGKFNAAKKDNDFVYHEKVPALDSLPDTKGASLVKGIAFNPNDPEVSGLDIFKKLVPMEAHEAASLYSEEKAKLLRCIGVSIEEKDKELETYMSSLQLDPTQIYPEPEKLPESLLEKCAAISVKPDAIQDLVASMQSLSSISTDVESGIKDIMDMLEEEDKRETEYQEVFGKRQRLASQDEIVKEYSKYQEGLTKAGQSNVELHRAMSTHMTNLKLISSPLDEIQAALPSMAQLKTPQDDEIIQEMRKLMGKVDEMKKQRVMLDEKFRDQVHKDDITNDIVTHEEGNQEEFFQTHLKKHSEMRSFLEQNLAAQDNILRALTETNAQYANIRKYIIETKLNREAMISGLIHSYDVYEDLLAKSNKGVEFYRKMETNVQRLVERTQRLCKAQEDERQMNYARTKPKAPAPARPLAPKPGQAAAAPAMDPELLGLPAAALRYMPTNVPGVPGGYATNLPGAPASVSTSSITTDMPPSLPTEGVGLKLKDYLPFMKPGTFGNKKAAAATAISATMGHPGMPAEGNSAAMMGAMYPGVVGGVGQIPQVSMVIQPGGSLPSSQTASPIHLPPVASSHPNSPAHYPTPHPGAATAQPPGAAVHHYGYPNGVRLTEQLTSPTAAPGAPSAGYRGALPSASAPYPRAPLGVTAPGGASTTLATAGVGVSHAPSGGMVPGGPSMGFYPGSAHIPQAQAPASAHPGQYPSPVASPAPQFQAPVSQTQIPHQSDNQMQPHPQVQPYASTQGQPQGQHNFQPHPQSQQPPNSNLPSSQSYPHYSQSASLPSTLAAPSPGQPITPYTSASHPAQQPPPTHPAPSQPPSQYPGAAYNPQIENSPHSQPANFTSPSQPYSSEAGYPVSRQQFNPAQASNQHSQPTYSQSAAPLRQVTPAASQAYNQGVPGHPGSTQQNTIPPTSAVQGPPGSQYGYSDQTSPQVQQPPAATWAQTQQPHNVSNQSQGQYPASVSSSTVAGSVAYSNQSTAAAAGGVGQTYQQPYGYSQSQPQHSTPSYTAGTNAAPIGTQHVPIATHPGNYGQAQSGVNNMTGVASTSVSSQPGVAGQQYPGYSQAPASQPSGYNTQGYSQAQPHSTPHTQYPQHTQSTVGSYAQTTKVSSTTSTSTPGQYQGQYPNNGQLSSSQASYTQQNQQPTAYTQNGGHPNISTQNAATPAQQTATGQYAPSQNYPNYTQSQAAAYPGAPANSNSTNSASNQNMTYANQNQPGQNWYNQNYNAQNNQQRPNNFSQQPPPQQLPIASPQTPNLPSPMQPTQIPFLPQQAPGQQPTPPQVTSPPPSQAQPPDCSRASSVPLETGKVSTPRLHHNTSSSSMDDILSSSPNNSKNEVLKPKVITAEEIQLKKEEDLKNSCKQPPQDPFVEAGVLERFIAETEKFEKHVEGLTKHTLSGPTPLDKEWKELSEDQDGTRKHSMAIARCYPLKNKYPDIMPYDATRVLLTSGSDDYINATHIGDMCPSCPKFIATQAPIAATLIDFWQMVYEQGTEVIVMLCMETELGGGKNFTYYPTEKGKQVGHGPFALSLQSVKEKPRWRESIITLTHRETRQSRSVVHLQFLNWTPGGSPESPAQLLQFITEAHMFYVQQRSPMKPVVIHCSNGVGRTGAFCVIYTGVQEINQGHSVVSVPELIQRLREKRKYMVLEKEQLKFCYQAILYYAQDLLMKRGILTNKASFGDKLPAPGEKGHQRKPSEDFILGPNFNLSTIQSNVAKMTVRPASPCVDSAENGHAGEVGQVNDVEFGTNHVGGSSEDVMPGTGVHSVASQGLGQTGSPGVGPCASPDTRSRAGSAGSVHSHNSSGSHSSSFSPQHKGVAAATGAPTVSQALADLQNPHTFKLDTTPPSKTKFTKANFTDKATHLADSINNPDDPLSMLDPLWSIKDKSQGSKS